MAANDLDRARQRLIVALDVPSADDAMHLLDRLEGQCPWLKVGLELFSAAGPAIVEKLVGRGHSVFLDLKFHDIPNTVAGAVRATASLGAKMLNVHAAGGPAMLTAAQEAIAGMTDPPLLLAVTVLTSMDQAQVHAVGLARPAAEQVKLLAEVAFQAGIRGLVCSAEELTAMRVLPGPKRVLVTPGIRPAGAEQGDQRRIATPAQALRDGADYLVVGRPITQAADPARAAAAILEEMAKK